MIDLPAGHTARPLADDDIDDVVSLVRTCEVHDSAAAAYERADLVADLALADRLRDTVIVSDPRGVLAAWGLILRRRTRWADVHPDHRGRGLGRALVDWSVARAGELGADRIGQTVEDTRVDAVALFLGSGALPVRTAWILRRDHEPALPPPPPDGVPGIVLRGSTPKDEVEALEMLELAFSEWPDRQPSTLATWKALVTRREGFTPDQLHLAVATDGRIVGAAFLIDDGEEVWVDKLGTHPEFRGRGIGRALLRQSFVLAHARGRRATLLSTDSNTGALPFYEQLGMRVTRSFTHWAIPLDGAGRAS
ncbi:MAG TPA: GNAT family N-acetyltransferase [Motilibacterales bacterium]|nr:GNAT family N-acetyltransferase [Motilibacterales bacterium]